MAAVNVAWFVLKHVAVVALIASTALAAGLPWVRRLSMSGIERAAVAMALGLALAGHVALGLGLVGRLEPVAIVALVVAAHLLARGDLYRLLSVARRSWSLRARRPRWLGVAVGVPALSPFVLCALYPPLAFDETMYHLPFARAFARRHGLAFLPDLRFPVFPQLVETLFAAVLQLAGDVATHGVSLVATLATALLVAGWAARAAGPGRGAAAGGLAAAILLGQPIAVHLGGSAYVEPALALFAAAAAYGADRWRTDGDRRWLVLAGLLAGTAASTKYLGLLILAGVSIEVAFTARRRGVAGDVLAYGAVVVAALAVTFGRLLYYTGSPLFPFFPDVFGSTPWSFAGFPRELGLQRGAALLTLPWQVVVDRQAVGGLPPFNPLLSLGLPFMLVVAWWNRQVRTRLLYAVGFVLLAPVGAHYLWMVVPFLAVAFGLSCAEALGRLRHALDRLPGAGRRGVLWAALVACVLPGWLYGVVQLVRLGPMPTDAATRADFLTARLPLFAAVRFLNERCGDACIVYALHAEHMVDFAAGRFLGDWNGPASFARTLPADGDPDEFRRRLRRLGADYLLVPTAVRGAIPVSSIEAPGFRRIYADRAADVYALSP
jgi:dolichyl-phosphate-mannose-protein mannosyltransferase